MILTLKVKPFVKHLLVKHYGKKTPIHISMNSDIGRMFVLGFGERSKAEDLIDPLDGEDEITLEAPEGTEEIDFYLGGKFDRMKLSVQSVQRMPDMLESYCRIFMKGFSTGYRCLLNSEMSSAVVFHRLYEYPEDTLTEANAVKIVQRENKEIISPIPTTPKKRYQKVVWTG